ncbi:15293_t:CDS:2 [Dentiscutata erythropus]|uniref:15293_t:CDS:1 n=1 Tax=Dentiscutata erythropus TaxID=1348616 RepID=A0A9N8ZYP8_9GLOM|nr:15293_t:CDS:2 [Dentiscutata erythropus]
MIIRELVELVIGKEPVGEPQSKRLKNRHKNDKRATTKNDKKKKTITEMKKDSPRKRRNNHEEPVRSDKWIGTKMEKMTKES